MCVTETFCSCCAIFFKYIKAMYVIFFVCCVLYRVQSNYIRLSKPLIEHCQLYIPTELYRHQLQEWFLGFQIRQSLPPVVCGKEHVLFTLFVYRGVQHILCCVFVLFFFVLCTLCCQFLWIVIF